MLKARETLAHVALFRSLDKEAVARLDTRCTWRHARAKEWLLEHDDHSTDVFFLTSGSVRVMIATSAERDVILADIDAGGFFGEMAAIDGQPRSAGILALTDATVARMSAAVFKDVRSQYPDVSGQLLELLVARVRGLNQRVHEFSALHVKHRICAELLRRSRLDPKDQRQAVVSPPPVHSEIAARVSTRREMVTRELKVLEREGLIVKRRGALVITDVRSLMQRLNEEQ